MRNMKTTTYLTAALLLTSGIAAINASTIASCWKDARTKAGEDLPCQECVQKPNGGRHCYVSDPKIKEEDRWRPKDKCISKSYSFHIKKVEIDGFYELKDDKDAQCEKNPRDPDKDYDCGYPQICKFLGDCPPKG
jgi:hypothetical protein